MGGRIDQFNPQTLLILATQFSTDIQKYPYLHPDAHMEESGNLEIKSSGHGIHSGKKISQLLNQFTDQFTKQVYPQVHMFVPQFKFDRLVQTNETGKFIEVLERLSLYLTMSDYEFATKESENAFDAWSVDRYSASDLKAVQNHLENKKVVSNTAQKYHNIGFRPVRGGVDLELRAFDGDEQLSLLIGTLSDVLNHPEKFKERSLHPFFHDFSGPFPEKNRFEIWKVLASKYSNLKEEDLETVRKLQFEVYKPSFGDFIHFEDFLPTNVVPAELMDAAKVIGNFESNLTLPLQPWEQQTDITSEGSALVAQTRNQFLDNVLELAKEINATPGLAFVKSNSNFLYLCDYLKRSRHASRPNFGNLTTEERTRQQRLLAEILPKMRSLVGRFIKDSKTLALITDNLYRGANL